jgi:hypothetical protein
MKNTRALNVYPCGLHRIIRGKNTEGNGLFVKRLVDFEIAKVARRLRPYLLFLEVPKSFRSLEHGK